MRADIVHIKNRLLRHNGISGTHTQIHRTSNPRHIHAALLLPSPLAMARKIHLRTIHDRRPNSHLSNNRNRNCRHLPGIQQSDTLVRLPFAMAFRLKTTQKILIYYPATIFRPHSTLFLNIPNNKPAIYSNINVVFLNYFF